MAKQKQTPEIEEPLITITSEFVSVDDTESKSLVALSPLESHLIALKSEASTVVITDKASLDRAQELVLRFKKFES